jgi:hypothetical protein
LALFPEIGPENGGSEPFLFARGDLMDDPKPEGKRVCRLNAFRHELTGQICVMSTDEQKAYDKHSKITLDALAPVGAYESDIAQSIADDRWRLKRARTIESSLFALGMQLGVDNTGAPRSTMRSPRLTPGSRTPKISSS